MPSCISGERSKQLCRNKVAMDAAPEYAQAMSKMSNLAEINAAMKCVPTGLPVHHAGSAPGPATRARG